MFRFWYVRSHAAAPMMSDACNAERFARRTCPNKIKSIHVPMRERENILRNVTFESRLNIARYIFESLRFDKATPYFTPSTCKKVKYSFFHPGISILSGRPRLLDSFPTGDLTSRFVIGY